MSAATQPSRAPVPKLIDRYQAVRGHTEQLCEPLEIEDFVVSSMPDVSPTKWHLAHTTWFFETFVLAEYLPGYRSPDQRYAFLFNSYYVQAGERHCRAQRGLVTRPTVAEVFDYRDHADEAMRQLITRVGDDREHPAYRLIELGLQHEQQHQELLLTDIKHVLWTNPLRPAYRSEPHVAHASVAPIGWHSIDPGVYHIGHQGPGFSFDNESPAHRVFLEPVRIASRLTTNGEYLQFTEAGGYRRAEYWLSAGWAAVTERGWQAPLYWERAGDGWTEFTLSGVRPLDPAEPACHLSYYEADAFARWAGRSLPNEAEWEVAAIHAEAPAVPDDSHRHHPQPAHRDPALQQLYGEVWQWTGSSYTAYPGYRAAGGAIGEYNGKWMADQWVLRGSSCATPPGHARRTYRNFFPSDARWQFTGIRLAERA